MTQQPPTMPAQLRWGLVACAAISIGIHLLLLIGLPKSQLAADFRPADYRAPGARTVQVRLVDGAGASAAPSPMPAAQKRKPPAKVAAATAAADIDSATGASGKAAVMAEASTIPISAAEPSEPSEFDDYLPRSLLSEPPEAAAEIVIQAPQEEQEFPGRRIGTLTLFIDEEGQVRHVAPDDILLPPALEQLAREAFMAGRFSPGRMNGQPAKSRMRVEVVFE